jgi:hypothetical protein
VADAVFSKTILLKTASATPYIKPVMEKMLAVPRSGNILFFCGNSLHIPRRHFHLFMEKALPQGLQSHGDRVREKVLGTLTNNFILF